MLSARRTFASSTEVAGRRYLTLHFEQLHCDDRTAICSATGCLHEVYEHRHGRFQKVTSLRTLELRVVGSSGRAVIETDCGLGSLNSLKWGGKRFATTEKRSVETKHLFGFTEGADVGTKGEVELENTFTHRLEGWATTTCLRPTLLPDTRSPAAYALR
jgi:hypothetical protein